RGRTLTIISSGDDPRPFSYWPVPCLQLWDDDGARLSGGRLRHQSRVSAPGHRDGLCFIDRGVGGDRRNRFLTPARYFQQFLVVYGRVEVDDLFWVRFCLVRRVVRRNLRGLFGLSVSEDRVFEDH